MLHQQPLRCISKSSKSACQWNVTLWVARAERNNLLRFSASYSNGVYRACGTSNVSTLARHDDAATDVVDGLVTLRCGLNVHSVSNRALLRNAVPFLAGRLALRSQDRTSGSSNHSGWRLCTLETQSINGWTREFGKLFRLPEDFTSRGRL
jgi:hypothetical protein